MIDYYQPSGIVAVCYPTFFFVKKKMYDIDFLRWLSYNLYHIRYIYMRIAIKIGSNVLLGTGHALNLPLMKDLVAAITALHNKGHEIFIITSGSVGAGYAQIEEGKYSRSVYASIGQAKLIRRYAEFFDAHTVDIAQILLSVNALKDRSRYDQLQNSLLTLIEHKVIPIVNENDVTILQDTFGDNDSLASMLAVMCKADKLIFLTM